MKNREFIVLIILFSTASLVFGANKQIYPPTKQIFNEVTKYYNGQLVKNKNNERYLKLEIDEQAFLESFGNLMETLGLDVSSYDYDSGLLSLYKNKGDQINDINLEFKLSSFLGLTNIKMTIFKDKNKINYYFNLKSDVHDFMYDVLEFSINNWSISNKMENDWTLAQKVYNKNSSRKIGSFSIISSSESNLIDEFNLNMILDKKKNLYYILYQIIKQEDDLSLNLFKELELLNKNSTCNDCVLNNISELISKSQILK